MTLIDLKRIRNRVVECRNCDKSHCHGFCANVPVNEIEIITIIDELIKTKEVRNDNNETKI